MTKVDLPGPSLNEAQWGSLRALATSLTAEQSNWVGGYFTGYADAVRLAGVAVALRSRNRRRCSPRARPRSARSPCFTAAKPATAGDRRSAGSQGRGPSASGQRVDMESYKPATAEAGTGPAGRHQHAWRGANRRSQLWPSSNISTAARRRASKGCASP